MCGIAGILRQNGAPVEVELIRRMTDIMTHRGPDGDGVFVEGAVGLGHRRLAIIDLAGGNQPMSGGDGAFWITYNGELYNFVELRRELSALGYSFRTNSDTEVILVAYQAWGADCVGRLRGMFAFAIWDRSRRRLFAARDRIGIKPLVYSWNGQSLHFASEIKGILADPCVPRHLDHEALVEYLTYLYVPGPRTIFRDIKKLPPASYLVCHLDGGAPEVHSYWDFRMVSETGRSDGDWAARLETALRDSVKVHMVSDVPIGAFLSGGVDSSAVVALMAQSSSRPIKTFSVGFDEADFDELTYARQVAARYGTEHFEIVVKPDVMAVLPKLAWQLDEPFGDASTIPTYCVSQVTREHVTVALSGDGGDENFAGYRRYAEADTLHRTMDGGLGVLLKPLMRRLGGLRSPGARGKEFLKIRGSDPLHRYHRMMTYQRGSTLSDLLEASTSEERFRGDRSGLGPKKFEQLAEQSGSTDYVSALQFIDFHSYLPDDILTKVDRASMLTSLETRVPLLDHLLIELVASMPVDLKLRQGVGKWLFKEVMRKHLPGDVLTRRKMGFGVPLAAWFRGRLKEFASDVLFDPKTEQRGILRPAGVRRLFGRHVSGARDYSSQLWSLICFELWCRAWWDR